MWYPTLAAKNASRMGHPSPTHLISNSLRMGQSAACAFFGGGFRGWFGAEGDGNGFKFGFAFGQLHQKVLAGEGRGVFEDLAGANVGAIALLQAGFHGVGKIGGQNLLVDAGAGGGIANREDYFAALEEIARHPVCGAEIDFVVAAVVEVEDAGVLEETPDD